jgi:hypothetical protein
MARLKTTTECGDAARLLSVKDVARLLQVSTKSVVRYVKIYRTLRAIKLPGSREWRFEVVEIQRFIDAGRVPGHNQGEHE